MELYNDQQEFFPKLDTANNSRVQLQLLKILSRSLCETWRVVVAMQL